MSGLDESYTGKWREVDQKFLNRAQCARFLKKYLSYVLSYGIPFFVISSVYTYL